MFQVPTSITSQPEWLILLLFAANLIVPYLTYRAGARKSQSDVNASDTQTSLLKINKIMELMEKVETAQTKYLELRDSNLKAERRIKQLTQDYGDFIEQVADVYALIVELVCDEDTKFTGLKNRMGEIVEEGRKIVEAEGV